MRLKTWTIKNSLRPPGIFYSAERSGAFSAEGRDAIELIALAHPGLFSIQDLDELPLNELMDCADRAKSAIKLRLQMAGLNCQ